MGLTTFLTMTRFGVSNGSVALATTRACRATPNHRLPNAASSGRDESAQRELVFRRPRLLVARGPIWFGVPVQ